MKTEFEIRQQLQILTSRIAADQEGRYEWAEERGEEGPDWTDTVSQIAILRWVLGEGDGKP